MSYISRYQWHKENCLKWMRRHRRDIAELIAAALFALFLGFITTCHTRKIEASFKGYQLKGIYSSNNGFEVLYQKTARSFQQYSLIEAMLNILQRFSNDPVIHSW